MVGPFAVVTNGVVTNIVLADSALAAEQGWVACPPTAGVGSSYNGSVFGAPPGPSAVWLNQNQIQASIASALPRLQQIVAANPNTVTLAQVAGAVQTLATDMIWLARLLSGQFDGTN